MVMNYTKGLVQAFEFALLLASMTALIAYLFTSVSFLVVIQSQERKKKMKGYLLASIAFIFSIWAIAGSGYEIVYWGFLLLMAGVPIFAIMKIQNKH